MANKPKKQSNKKKIFVLLGALVFVLICMYLNVFYVTDDVSGHSGMRTFMFVLTMLLSAVAFGLIVYFIIASKMNKNRCPKCKMVDDYIIVRDKEISHDVQMVTKPIQKKIRDANGQVIKTTREIAHVTVVNSVSHQQRKCKNCYNMWDVTIKKHIEY